MTAEQWLHGFDLAGTAVFAASGALAAGRRSLDLLGVFFVAAVTAVGGGTTRDLLLDRHPIFWLAHPAYLATIGLAAAATVAWSRRVRRPGPAEPGRALLLAAALGLPVERVRLSRRRRLREAYVVTAWNRDGAQMYRAGFTPRVSRLPDKSTSRSAARNLTCGMWRQATP